jgi:hypothetical protein
MKSTSPVRRMASVQPTTGIKHIYQPLQLFKWSCGHFTFSIMHVCNTYDHPRTPPKSILSLLDPGNIRPIRTHIHTNVNSFFEFSRPNHTHWHDLFIVGSFSLLSKHYYYYYYSSSSSVVVLNRLAYYSLFIYLFMSTVCSYILQYKHVAVLVAPSQWVHTDKCKHRHPESRIRNAIISTQSLTRYRLHAADNSFGRLTFVPLTGLSEVISRV